MAAEAPQHKAWRMLNRIFPRQFDNDYRGHWLGIALFILVIALKAVQGVNSIMMTHQVMTTADGIPVDSYGPAAAAAAMSMFALLGMYLLVLPIIGLVALIRYRTMIPFLFVMLLLVQLSSRILQTVNPIERIAEPSMGYAGHPIGFWINLAILTVTALGFFLSIMNRSKSPAVAEGAR
jgi:hypothetical protein